MVNNYTPYPSPKQYIYIFIYNGIYIWLKHIIYIYMYNIITYYILYNIIYTVYVYVALWHYSSCAFGIVSYAPWRISKGNWGMHASGPWLNFLVVSDCQKNDWWFNPSEKYGNHQKFLGIIPFLCLNQWNQQANLISHQLSQGQFHRKPHVCSHRTESIP